MLKITSRQVRLSHIIHDAHDANFHALWQQLRDEHEQLVRKGYTGEGFLSKGQQLGGRRIPMDEARRRARAAAEKRRALTAGSGQRLGGMPVRRGADMRRVIADAAQRRLTVTKGCGLGTKETRAIIEQATRTGFRTQAEEDDANERAIMEAYIELLQEDEKEKWGDAYVPSSAQNPSGSASEAEKPQGSQGARTERRPRSSSASSSAPPDKKTSPAPTLQAPLWTCSICTLENPLNYLCCDACGTERPGEVSSRIATNKPSKQANRSLPSAPESCMRADLGFWVCHQCDTVMESQWWTCSDCGVMKLQS